MATEVSVLDKYGETTYYSNYADARMDIINSEIEHPLVQIWADIDEQIILLDEADIWIAPGVTISNSSGDTITDNNVAVKCNISGYGNLTQTSTSSYAVCNFTNSNSKVSVKCDIIENESAGQACVSSSAKKFHLECNLVYGKSHGAVFLNNNNSNDLNINAEKILTGQIGEPSTGTTAIISRGNGFMHINEILCRNLGHCFSHRAGEIIADIRKMTTINNRTGNISTVHQNQGTNDQVLVLYFDEIQCITGSSNSLSAIELKQGTGIFIGRRLYSDDTVTVIIGKDTPNSDPPQSISIRCNEIICSNEVALTINDSVHQNYILANRIETSYFVVIYSNGGGNFVLKNPTVRNTSSSTDAIGIGVDTNQTLIELNNVKIVAGNSTSGRPIFVGNSTQMNVFNYGLFSNAPLNPSLTLLKIGTDSNFLFIQSEDLT